MTHTLEIERQPTGWWLIPIGEPDGRIPVGPYKTKSEAEEDRAGLERTERLFTKEEAAFRLENPPAKNAKATFPVEKKKQVLLFGGLDCLAGQQDLL